MFHAMRLSQTECYNDDDVDQSYYNAVVLERAGSLSRVVFTRMDGASNYGSSNLWWSYVDGSALDFTANVCPKSRVLLMLAYRQLILQDQDRGQPLRGVHCLSKVSMKIQNVATIFNQTRERDSPRGSCTSCCQTMF